MAYTTVGPAAMIPGMQQWEQDAQQYESHQADMETQRLAQQGQRLQQESGRFALDQAQVERDREQWMQQAEQGFALFEQSHDPRHLGQILNSPQFFGPTDYQVQMQPGDNGQPWQLHIQSAGGNDPTLGPDGITLQGQSFEALANQLREVYDRTTNPQAWREAAARQAELLAPQIKVVGGDMVSYAPDANAPGGFSVQTLHSSRSGRGGGGGGSGGGGGRIWQPDVGWLEFDEASGQYVPLYNAGGGGGGQSYRLENGFERSEADLYEDYKEAQANSYQQMRFGDWLAAQGWAPVSSAPAGSGQGRASDGGVIRVPMQRQESQGQGQGGGRLTSTIFNEQSVFQDDLGQYILVDGEKRYYPEINS